MFNFVIINKHWEERLERGLFGDEPVMHLPESTTIFDILVLAKVFPSKGQARKNWKTQDPSVPPGWSDFMVGKTKIRICILHPIHDDDCPCNPQ